MIDPKEVAIVGMGPAGVAAAIYLKRYNMTPVCFEKDLVGGKTNYTEKIENYPGYLGLKGPQLAQDFAKQLDEFDIKPIYREVKSITKNEDGTYRLAYGKEEHDFKYVILANGLVEKPFDIEGQDTFHKRGFSRCAICDGMFYRGKDVAVIGGGNAAFEEAIYLASICNSVFVIAHHSNLKAMPSVIDRFNKLENTKVYAPYDTVLAKGEKSLESLVIRNNETKEEVTLNVQGLFIYVGEQPRTEFVHIDGLTDEKGFFITDERKETKSKNLFAVGDSRDTTLRQVTMAVADGSLAATSIHDDYQKNN